MKTVRGNAHDLEQIEEIGRHQSIELDTLVDRFRNEMKHVIGNPRTVQLNFLATVAVLFGEKKAEDVERILGAPGTLNRC